MRSLLIFFSLLLTASTSFGATQFIDEDFEDVTGLVDNFGCFQVDNTGVSFATDPNISSADLARPFHMACVDGCDLTDCDDPGDDSADGVRGGMVSGSECPGGIGQCLRAWTRTSDLNGRVYSEPKVEWSNVIPEGSSTFYVRFDIRLDANSCEDDDCSFVSDPREVLEFDEFKILRITDTSDAGDADIDSAITVNFRPGSTYYTLYDGNTAPTDYNIGSNVGETRIANSLLDNQWHTLEFYFEMGSLVQGDTCSQVSDDCDGIVRIWESDVDGSNRTLLVEDLNAPMRGTTNSTHMMDIKSVVTVRHEKSNDSVVSDGNNIYYDNFEVWDGMPDAAESTESSCSGSFSIH